MANIDLSTKTKNFSKFWHFLGFLKKKIAFPQANSLLRGYEARDKLLDADYIHLMLKMVGALPWEMELLNEEAAKIPADKLDSDIKARVMKMLNGFARGSSLENVTASLVSS